MMIVYDTYVVAFRLRAGDEKRTLRVSQPDLEGFIKVLLFNDAELIEAQKENPHRHDINSMTATGFPKPQSKPEPDGGRTHG